MGKSDMSDKTKGTRLKVAGQRGIIEDAGRSSAFKSFCALICAQEFLENHDWAKAPKRL